MIKLQLSSKTEQRLKQLMLLHGNKESFFKKLIDNHIREMKLGVHNIEQDLKQFENKYDMDSQLFYEKFSNGELSDEIDFITWSGIYEMYLKDKAKIKKLER